MDIGVDAPEDFEELRRCLEVIKDVQHRHEAMDRTPEPLWTEDSAIARLVSELPDPPVDIRISIQAGLSATSGCLQQIAAFITDEIPTTPIVLGTLARTALLGAARIVFMLGPEHHAERLLNSGTVLRQETDSLMRLYRDAEQFTSLLAFVPPPDVLSAQRERAKPVNALGPALGEAKTLQAASLVVVDLRARGPLRDDSPAPMHSEHVAWTFNVYSGLAHGFGWPKLVPGTKSLPGVFTAELGLIVGVAQLAFHLFEQRSRPGL